MNRKLWLAVTVAWLVGCKGGHQAPAHRLEIRKVTNSSVLFVPTEKQLPYCLVFTQSEKGIIRQMTMTHSDMSVPCPNGQPILNVRFRLPVDEGKINTIVFFSSQRL